MKIPWLSPQVGKKERQLIDKVLANGYLNEGKYTRMFDEEIRKLLGCKYAISVTSGTAAMFISLKALGIGFGDEVIVPDLTFIATANAVAMTGALPVLVDVDIKTLTMDSEAFRKAITKKTKAVIPVHVSGRGADMKAILTIAKKHNIEVVEDAAEAFMSKYKGKYLGTWGRLGCFSWSPAKIITTGQGGTIVTNDERLQTILRQLKDQGRSKQGTGGDDIHDGLGYNFKWTDLQAAVGLGQLSNLKERIDKKIRHYLLYKKYLNHLSQVSIFDFDIENGELPLWTDGCFQDRDKLDKYLSSKQIDCRRFWFPVNTQHPYKLQNNNFSNATYLAPKILWLPSGMDMTDKEVKVVSDQIKTFYNNFHIKK